MYWFFFRYALITKLTINVHKQKDKDIKIFFTQLKFRDIIMAIVELGNNTNSRKTLFGTPEHDFPKQKCLGKSRMNRFSTYL